MFDSLLKFSFLARTFIKSKLIQFFKYTPHYYSYRVARLNTSFEFYRTDVCFCDMLRIGKVKTKSGSPAIWLVQYDMRIPQSSTPRRLGFSFFGMTSAFGNNGEEVAGRRIEVFVEKGIVTGGLPLLPPLFPKACVIPKKENPSLRGFDD
jgi:hypothetical protein